MSDYLENIVEHIAKIEAQKMDDAIMSDGIMASGNDLHADKIQAYSGMHMIIPNDAADGICRFVADNVVMTNQKRKLTCNKKKILL